MLRLTDYGILSLLAAGLVERVQGITVSPITITSYPSAVINDNVYTIAWYGDNSEERLKPNFDITLLRNSSSFSVSLLRADSNSLITVPYTWAATSDLLGNAEDGDDYYFQIVEGDIDSDHYEGRSGSVTLQGRFAPSTTSAALASTSAATANSGNVCDCTNANCFPGISTCAGNTLNTLGGCASMFSGSYTCSQTCICETLLEAAGNQLSCAIANQCSAADADYSFAAVQSVCSNYIPDWNFSPSNCSTLSTTSSISTSTRSKSSATSSRSSSQTSRSATASTTGVISTTLATTGTAAAALSSEIQSIVPITAQQDAAVACFLMTSYSTCYTTPTWYASLDNSAQSYFSSINAQSTASCTVCSHASGNKGLSKGAKAGIAVGVIAAVAILAGIVFMILMCLGIVGSRSKGRANNGTADAQTGASGWDGVSGGPSSGTGAAWSGVGGGEPSTTASVPPPMAQQGPLIGAAGYYRHRSEDKQPREQHREVSPLGERFSVQSGRVSPPLQFSPIEPEANQRFSTLGAVQDRGMLRHSQVPILDAMDDGSRRRNDTGGNEFMRQPGGSGHGNLDELSGQPQGFTRSETSTSPVYGSGRREIPGWGHIQLYEGT